MLHAFSSRQLCLATATLSFALLNGCSGGNTAATAPTTPTSPSPTPTVSNPFGTTVFLGDSLTAGYQNGSLLDTQQTNGFASLIAQQANFAITLPLIGAPGAPAVLQLISTGLPPIIQQAPGITAGRDDASVQPTDLAVPGHKLHDLINAAPTLTPKTDEDIMTDLVLGFPVGNSNTQLQEAIALKPTTVFLWIGNNDALAGIESGTPASMTTVADFTTDFTQLITTLKAQTSANLVVANIPDVTAIPYLTPSSTIINAFVAFSGLQASVVQQFLGLTPGELVNAKGVQAIEAGISSLQPGQNSITLDDSDILTPDEISTIQATIDSYNQVIQQQVSAAGGTLVDMHSYFATLKAGVTVNGVAASTTYLGGLFSLDGIHPTNTGYALLANQFIAAVNAKFSLSIAATNVNGIAAADPLFGPSIKPIKPQLVHIPANAALQADALIRGWKKR